MTPITNQQWIERMERCSREVHLQDDYPYSCLLFEKGKLLALGVSTENLEDAIRDCRYKFSMANFIKLIDKANTRLQQKANIRAAKSLLKQ